LEALEIAKDEQERLAWKFQEEVDSLSEQLDLIHRNRTDGEKEVKLLKQRLQETKENAEENLRGKNKADLLLRELQAEIEDLKDRLAEEEDRGRELQSFKLNNFSVIQDLKKALDREISSREALEEAKRFLDRENRGIAEQLEEERNARLQIDNDLRKLNSELDDSRGLFETVNNTIDKLEKARRGSESDFRDVKQKSAELQKRLQRDSATKSRIEAEIRKLRNKLLEEQDRAAQSESTKRKAEVEISKYRDDIRSLTEELDRARSSAKQALEEKRELEERARGVSRMWR